MDDHRTLVMACATVIEEMLPLLPEGMQHQVFDFGLHIVPDKLRSTLQEAIDAVDPEIETILLGYGMCSQAVIGLTARHATLVVPRVDDCIAIFMGSPRRVQHAMQSRTGHLLFDQGLDRSGGHPLFGV